MICQEVVSAKPSYMNRADCRGLEAQGRRLSLSFNHGAVVRGLGSGLTKLKECCRGKNLIRECKVDYRVGNFNPRRRQMTSITFPPDQPHSPCKAQLKQHTLLESLEIP